MPIIKSAKKKMLQDAKKTKRNYKIKNDYKKAVKKVKTSSAKSKSKYVRSAHSLIDTAFKKGVIHKNKASRLKHQVSIYAKNKSIKGK